jgi:hypothetical protein
LVGVFEGAEEGVGCGGVVGSEGEGVLQIRDGGLWVAGGHLVEGAVDDPVEGGVGGCCVGRHEVSIDGEKDDRGLVRMNTDQ